MKPKKRMVAFFNIGRQLDHEGNLVSSDIVRNIRIVRARSGNAGHAGARPADAAAAVVLAAAEGPLSGKRTLATGAPNSRG